MYLHTICQSVLEKDVESKIALKSESSVCEC